MRDISKKKCYLRYNLLTDQILLSDYLYFLRYWAIFVFMCIAIICFPGFFHFSNQAVFIHEENVNEDNFQLVRLWTFCEDPPLHHGVLYHI